MIKIVNNFFEDEMFKKIQHHISTKINFTPLWYDNHERNENSYYGGRFPLLYEPKLKDIFVKTAEKKFKIKIEDLCKTSGIDLRHLNILRPHTDEAYAKINILIMLKGPKAVTNGTVFFTEDELDIHVGFLENRAVMFPSNYFHSPHVNTSEDPNLRRYTSTLFVKEYKEV